MIKKTVRLFLLMLFSLSTSSAFAINPLPSNLIALSSSQGTQIFNRSYSREYFWPLNLQFVTQKNNTYCSIASSVMVLNALDIPGPTDSLFGSYKTFTQDNFFTRDVEKVLPSERVKKQGSTLDEMSLALKTFPVSVKTIHANEITVSQFRELAKKTIANQDGYIIVNFLRTSLGEEGIGHMSPLAAYDPATDRFLMLDVARYRYPSAWVKTQDLWNAINTWDKDSGRYRGFLIVQK